MQEVNGGAGGSFDLSGFVGNAARMLEQQRQLVEQQRQREAVEQQNALIAEQNQRIAEAQEAEAAKQRQQEALAQRESGLKQYLFDVNQSLDDLEQAGDHASILALADGFRSSIQQHSFAATDLSQIVDKQYFGKTVKRIDSLCSQIDDQCKSTFQQFKTLYQRYLDTYAGRLHFPEADSEEFREKQKLQSYQVPIPQWNEPSEEVLNALLPTPETLIGLRRKRILYRGLVVGVMLTNVCIPGLACLLAAGVYLWGLRPADRQLAEFEEEFEQDLLTTQQSHIREQRQQHQTALEDWKKKKRRFDQNMPSENAAIDEHNETLLQRREDAQAEWSSKKLKAVRTINAYLERHPGLLSWYQRADEGDAGS